MILGAVQDHSRNVLLVTVGSFLVSNFYQIFKKFLSNNNYVEKSGRSLEKTGSLAQSRQPKKPVSQTLIMYEIHDPMDNN